MTSNASWRYVIIGGGLAGLTVAYFLGPSESLVLEREPEVGGVCRSIRVGDFVFDYTGHLLHFKHPENREWVVSLLGSDALVEYHRRAFIYVYDRYVPYPFQVNLYGLPPEVIFECLHGFIEMLLENPERKQTDSFKEWIETTFGRGIARHFMIPYNRKFWCRDLDTITTDWVSWAIPRPGLEDVLRGALGIVDREYGYNPVFWYPRTGGIQILPESIARHLPHVKTRTAVQRIRWKERRVVTSAGVVAYDTLIATQPLPDIVRQLDPPVPELSEMARRLRALTVVNYNLGIRGSAPVDAHWIYYPESRFVFYRVGFASNFAPTMAPAGTYSLYVEVSLDETQGGVDLEILRERVINDLQAAGLLASVSDVIVEHPLIIRPAYVIFDRDRREIVPHIRAYLESHGIFTVGRYAEWAYYSMDDTIHSARSHAEKIREREHVR